MLMAGDEARDDTRSTRDEETGSENSGVEDLVEQVGEALAGLQRSLALLDAAAAAHMDISATDLQCLAILLQEGGAMTAGQLAAESRLTPGSVTALVDRLERAGYVHRVRDEADRRRVLVELTPRAYEQADETYGDIAAAGRDLARGLSTTELVAIRDFLRAWGDAQARQADHLRGCSETADELCAPSDETGEAESSS